MFTSYHIAFRSASQYYTVRCGYFHYIYVEYEFKNFDHYFHVLMEYTTIWKKYKRKYSYTNNKKMMRESKIHFFWTDDAVAFFIGSPIQIQMSIWRSELGVNSFKYEIMQEIIVESYPKTNEDRKNFPNFQKILTVLFSSLSMLPPLSRTYFALIRCCVHISKIVQKITSLQISLRYVPLRKA